MECKHKKVYSTHDRLDAQFHWICKTCGERGIDHGEFLNEDEYIDLVQKFHPIDLTNPYHKSKGVKK